VRIGVTAAGQVTITGRYPAEVGALLDAKFGEDPSGICQSGSLPARVDAFRAQHDHLPVTRRDGV
jgi:hypothetical protein